jgi:orotate phosphoribosyltransferase
MIPSLSLEEGRAYLKELIKGQAVLKGEFLLASGKRSSLYVDLRRVSLDPVGAFWIGRLLYHEISLHPAIEAVGGPTLGADPLVSSTTLIALLFGRKLKGFLIRKEPKGHGLGRLLEGPPLPPGTPVCIVEDVVTSGGSVLRAISSAEEEGLEVQLVLSLLDRGEGGEKNLQEKGYLYRPLFRLSELL